MVETPVPRKRPTPTELKREIAELKRERDALRVHYRRFVAFAEQSLPERARRKYDEHRLCQTRDELGHLLSKVVDLLIDDVRPLPEPVPGSFEITGVRVPCPLCAAESLGPYVNIRPGWGFPGGLETHLKSRLDHISGNGCAVMQMLREYAFDEFEKRHPAA